MLTVPKRLSNLKCFFVNFVQVIFATPVSMAAHPKINEWLTQVEKEMRVTLAKLLSQAVHDMAAFKSGKIEQGSFMTWVDKYQVTLSRHLGDGHEMIYFILFSNLIPLKLKLIMFSSELQVTTFINN